MKKYFIILISFTILSFNSFAKDIFYQAASPKPTLVDALRGMTVYTLEWECNGNSDVNNAATIDLWMVKTLESYLDQVCSYAKLNDVNITNPRIGSVCFIKLKYNRTLGSYSNFWGQMVKHVFTNVSIDFSFGDVHTYSVKLGNFDYKDIDPTIKPFYNLLVNRVVGYRLSPQQTKISLAKYKTQWNEEKLKFYFNSNINEYEGIYEGMVPSDSEEEVKYKLALKKMEDGTYCLLYIDMKCDAYKKHPDWEVGEVKAFLESTATPGLFKAKWILVNKQISNDFYVSLFEGGLKVSGPGDTTTYVKLYPTTDMISNSKVQDWSGSGFALNEGYIVTNYHVVEDAKSISVLGVQGDFNNAYEAHVVVSDKNNDIAIIKLDDKVISNIPYSIKKNISDVGENIWVLGYPLTATMGEEIKLTTGVISAKSGFEGDLSQYQISAPVQPGNSGGPVFDNKGNLIGIVCAHHKGAENVSYAIKSSYLSNLAESYFDHNILPQNNKISTLNLPGKVKNVKNFVYYIKCSNRPSTSVKPQSTSTSLPQQNNTQNKPKSNNYTPKKIGRAGNEDVYEGELYNVMEEWKKKYAQ